MVAAGYSNAHRRTLRTVIAAAALTVVAAGLTGCATAAPPAKNGTMGNRIGVTVFPAGARKPLPAVTARALDGSSLAVRRLAGHGVLVLNVWASWCAQCRQELPALARLSTALRNDHVRFVGVDEQDTLTKASAFRDRTGIGYPSLFDPDGHVLGALSVLPDYGIPSTLVVDAQGLMAARIIGATSESDLRQLIVTIAAEQ